MSGPVDLVQSAIVLSPFGKLLGLEADKVERDLVRVRMPYSVERTTVGDLVHGGAIASLVDVVATAAAWSGVDDPSGWRGTTIGLSLSFLEGARGADLVAEGRVVRRGGSVCVVDVDVRSAAGAHVAHATATYKLSRAEPKPVAPAPGDALREMFAARGVVEQRALLAQLERAGAGLYRAWAENEPDPAARAALLAAAEREVENALVLERALAK
jgi:uncharacterized protein (TIGR00369 family)